MIADMIGVIGMLGDCEQLQLQLLEVLRFEDRVVTMKTRARPFYALSLRWDGNTEIVLQNNKKIKLEKRDLALFHPNLSYTRYSYNDCRIVFHFNVLNKGTAAERKQDIEILHDFRYDTMLPLFLEADRIWHNAEPGYHVRCTALLYSVFAEIFENQKNRKPLSSELVSAALAYMEQNYSDSEMTVADIASHLHISTTHLRNCFQHDLGTTPKAHLTALRMTRAQTLLNTGYYSVVDTAKHAGFHDAKNFATAFKKYFGYAPSKQRYEDFL